MPGAALTASVPPSITPSSPARTSSRSPRVEVKTTAPRVTWTWVMASVAVTDNRVPITSIRPLGVVIAAGAPSTWVTSAASRPAASRIWRASAA